MVTSLPCTCPLPHVVLPNHTFVPGTGPPFSHPTVTNLIDERIGVGLGDQGQSDQPGPFPPVQDTQGLTSGSSCREGVWRGTPTGQTLTPALSECFGSVLQLSPVFAFSEQGLSAAQMGRPKDISDSCPTEAQRHLPDGAGLHAEDSSLPHAILPESGGQERAGVCWA